MEGQLVNSWRKGFGSDFGFVAVQLPGCVDWSTYPFEVILSIFGLLFKKPKGHFWSIVKKKAWAR